jgi:divalent metal cation (Fe/Co/Zn/Cd) transporter
VEIIFCCWLVCHRNPSRNASQTSRSSEAVIAAGAGIAAGSIALVGFGLDSLVEVFAASVALWHLRGGVDEQREQRALQKGQSARVTERRPQTLTPAQERWSQLRRRGLRLEYATLGWNVFEIGFLIFAAITARSVALAGFALDSLIEVFASVVVIWQLRGTATPEREHDATRLIGLAFFGLALYIRLQAAITVALDVRPDSSPLGIIWLSATCVVMFGLAGAKARTGRELGNPVLTAEARVTLVDGALAAGILVGLVLNALIGWWWADVAAGGILVVYGIREGREHLRPLRLTPPHRTADPRLRSAHRTPHRTSPYEGH